MICRATSFVAMIKNALLVDAKVRIEKLKCSRTLQEVAGCIKAKVPRGRKGLDNILFVFF